MIFFIIQFLNRQQKQWEKSDFECFNLDFKGDLSPLMVQSLDNILEMERITNFSEYILENDEYGKNHIFDLIWFELFFDLNVLG